MAEKVIMPKQGLQMTEGTIIKWLVKEGGDCEAGEPLFEMETDKLTIEIESPASGKLLKIIHGEGETVPITELIAVIGQENEDISSLVGPEKKIENNNHAPEPIIETGFNTPPMHESGATKTGSGRVFITPRAKALADSMGIDFAKTKGTGPDGIIVERDIQNTKVSPKATPLAKKVAFQAGVDISDVTGSGKRGKISKADVQESVSERETGTERSGKMIPFAGMRKVIAERMVESLRTAAQLTHRISVDMTEATRLRKTYTKEADRKISYNDIVSFAVCRALIDYPIMNSELTEDGILLKDYVNLGIAVALDDGLIVPVVRDADMMTLEELSIMMREMAGKAKNGTLKPDEYKGGSFTISNLGMYGLDSFTAIINQPESGILAVGAIVKKPVVLGEEILIRPMMELTLSYDHRVADGAPAAQFLAKIKQYLEQPYLLL